MIGPGGTLYYARKYLSESWLGPVPIPDVVATHDPDLAVGYGGEVRLFFRDASAGALRFLKWSGSTWGQPTSIPGVTAIARGPSADWDEYRNRYVVAYVAGSLDAAGDVSLVEITPTTGGDNFSTPVTLSECVYNSASHPWEGPVALSVVGDGKIYLVGVHGMWEGYGMELQQGTVELCGPMSCGSVWKMSHHGRMERLGDGIDMDGTFAVTWIWELRRSHAHVFSK